MIIVLYLYVCFTDSVFLESARLASGVFMIRYIKEDTWFNSANGKQFLLRAGDRVTMYPPAYHKDPEVFEDPHVSIFNIYIYIPKYVNICKIQLNSKYHTSIQA